MKIRDRQTLPFLMIPREFFRRFEPSWRASLTYTALKYYASVDAGTCENISIRLMAKTVNISEDTMKRGLAELVKKGAVKVYRRSKKTAKGQRVPLPNLYELISLDPGEPI